MIKLLIFDLDGTLMDTAPGITSAFNQLTSQYGEPPIDSKTVIENIGNGIRDLLVKLNSKLLHQVSDIAQLERDFHVLYKKTYLAGSHIFDGLMPFLKKWPHKLAVASNKSEFYVHNLLNRTELNQFEWSSVVCGDTLRVKKPHPDVIKRVLKECNVKPREALIIGDGLPDTQVAIKSGIYSMAVSFGYTELSQLIRSGAHCTINNYREAEKVIRALS